MLFSHRNKNNQNPTSRGSTFCIHYSTLFRTEITKSPTFVTSFKLQPNDCNSLNALFRCCSLIGTRITKIPPPAGQHFVSTSSLTFVLKSQNHPLLSLHSNFNPMTVTLSMLYLDVVLS